MIDIRDTPDGVTLTLKRGGRALREVSIHQPEERFLDVDCLNAPFNPKPERGSDAPHCRSSRPQAGNADQG